MAGQVKHLKLKDGRFYARMAVPKALQGQAGKTELVIALGADRRAAMRQLPGAVAELQRQIIDAERKLARSHPIDHEPVLGRYPMTPAQIAASHYAQRLILDEHFRDNPVYAELGIDDGYVENLRAAVAGRATNAELAELIGREVEWFRQSGNHDAAPGTAVWREIARALAVAELEFLSRMVERNEGDFAGKPDNPMIVNATPPEDTAEPVSLTKLWQDYKPGNRSAISVMVAGDSAR